MCMILNPCLTMWEITWSTRFVESNVCQWRSVISGGPRFKMFEGPPSRSTKGTSWAPYMHEFFRGSSACSPGKILNLESLKCHFPDFGERFYRILMVRKQHCNISEASLANVFTLQPEPGGPHLAHSGVGAPGFARSEPIVVAPLTSVHRLTCPHPYFNANNLLMIINVRETQLKRNYF